MVKVVLSPKKEIKVVLKPQQGVQINESRKYLFDPAIVQEYVDASAENAELSQQIYDQFVAESDEFKEEVKVISRETAKDEVSGVVAEVEANVEIAKEASQSAAESAEKAEQNAAKVPDPYEENTALIYKDGVVQWGKAAAENDGVSITENAKGQIQTIGVIDNNGEATKIWNGTRGEFDALEEKDDDTLYNVVDDETDDVAVSSFEIGDIGIAPLGIDETQNKRRYLNGQIILQAQFASFTAKVKNAILLYPSLGATEENWQAEVTNSKLGQCGKFVIDDTLGTIRLPKVVNINGLQDLALMGSIKAESLPNITGSLNPDDQFSFQGYFMNPKGALGTSGTARGTFNSGYASSGFYCGFDIDASRSSSTYQDNAPVQQEAIRYPYFIQVATGVEESIDVTREIQLNNPFFFGMSQYFESVPNNASWLLSNGAFHSGSVYVSFYQWLLRIYNGADTVDGVSVKLHTETYGDYDYVINTADTTFRLPIRTSDDYVVESFDDGTNWHRVYKSGWVEQGGVSSVASRTATLTVEMASTNYGVICIQRGTSGPTSAEGSPRAGAISTTQIFVNGGAATNDVYWQVSGQCAEIPTSKTYFYVGETVQDANIIVASGLLNEIANADYVVERYNDNSGNWCRVYKSGWVEQGGQIVSLGVGSATSTVTFKKPFTDNNYTLTFGTFGGGFNSGEANFRCTAYTESSATFYNNSGTVTTYKWYACGQGAK